MNILADLLGGDGPVLTDELEFPTVTLPWVHRGIPVHFVPAAEGVVWLESFEKPNAPRAATIAISHVQFWNGCRQDLAEFGRIKADRHLVVSASQSAGALPIDVHGMGVDGLASAGQKWMCAGYGAGFVYVRRELLEKKAPKSIGWMSVEDPFAFENRTYRLLPSAARHELGAPAFAGIFALGAAVDYWTNVGKALVVARVLELNRYLCAELARIGTPILSPGGHYRSGETLIGVPDPPRAAAFLSSKGILVTRKPEGLRVSTHCYNTESDVDTLVRALIDYQRDY
jgi:selenocysteine lyase/cysteine desulfurase